MLLRLTSSEMTGDLMAFAHTPQLWLFRLAARLGQRAARAERAPRRAARDVGHVASHAALVNAPRRIRLRHGGDERLRVRVARRVDDLPAHTRLDHPTEIHYADAA